MAAAIDQWKRLRSTVPWTSIQTGRVHQAHFPSTGCLDFGIRRANQSVVPDRSLYLRRRCSSTSTGHADVRGPLRHQRDHLHHARRQRMASDSRLLECFVYTRSAADCSSACAPCRKACLPTGTPARSPTFRRGRDHRTGWDGRRFMWDRRYRARNKRRRSGCSSTGSTATTKVGRDLIRLRNLALVMN